MNIRAWLRKIKNPPYGISVIQKKEISAMMGSLRKGGRVLNIGSKDTGFSGNVINVDIVSYPGVDIVADAHKLPFAEGEFDAVIIIALLEIVKDPAAVIAEVHRVLKTNGRIIASLPFMQPYHPDPTDYHRFTIEGARELFLGFREEKMRCTRGIFGMFVWILREFLALLFSFNNENLFKAANIIFGWLLFPLNYLDYILPEYRRLYYISSSFIFIGRKA
jgi:SAM-dependent methyltransferase